MSRLLTPAEHARVKTIPENLIEGLSATTAHEVLGQSVIFSAFIAVGELIAKTVKGLVVPLKNTNVAQQEETAGPVEAPKQAPAPQANIAPATMPLFALTA